MTIYAILRYELLEREEIPPLIGKEKSPIDWKTFHCECFQPDELDNEEFNLILKSDEFVNGYAMAMSIDFSFYEKKGCA